MRSISGHFLNILLFWKHAFRPDETIVFEELGGLISVLFRYISQYPFQGHTFCNILSLFGSQGSICGPKWVSLGPPGASFWSYFVDAVPAWGPGCAVGAKKYHLVSILEVILSPFETFLGALGRYFGYIVCIHGVLLVLLPRWFSTFCHRIFHCFERDLFVSCHCFVRCCSNIGITSSVSLHISMSMSMCMSMSMLHEYESECVS